MACLKFMSFVFQALSVLVTILFSTLSVLLGLPYILLYNVILLFRSRKPEAQRGCAFYEGNIVHIRSHPLDHEFTYPLRLALIDLDEPPNWFKGQLKHYWTSQECREKTGTDGKVKLLTSPACCNYSLNPTSVYYCFSSCNTLERCIAEVTNTPYGARVNYVFDPRGDRFSKALHVSHFMDMDLDWKIKTELNDEQLVLSIKCFHHQHGDFFDVFMHLRRSENGDYPNEKSGFRTLWKYGFLPHKVALWIYWQCSYLFRKGIPLYGCPRIHKIKAKVGKKNKCVKFESGEGFIWRSPESYPWSQYA